MFYLLRGYALAGGAGLRCTVESFPTPLIWYIKGDPSRSAAILLDQRLGSRIFRFRFELLDGFRLLPLEIFQCRFGGGDTATKVEIEERPDGIDAITELSMHSRIMGDVPTPKVQLSEARSPVARRSDTQQPTQ